MMQSHKFQSAPPCPTATVEDKFAYEADHREPSYSGLTKVAIIVGGSFALWTAIVGTATAIVRALA